MTSRLSSSRDHVQDDDCFEEITGLDPGAAAALIRKIASSSASAEVQERAAKNIAIALEYHPLAISVASSLIHEGWCEIDEYIIKSTEVFTQKELLSRTTTGSRYDKINETFEVTARVLEQRAATEGRARDGLELLNVMAFMQRLDIRQDIFTSAWTYEDVVAGRSDDMDNDELINHLGKWHVRQSKSVLGIDDIDERTAAWRSVCAYLASLSLVKWNRDAKSVAIHPLIHTWTRHRLASRSLETWLKAASILTLASHEQIRWTPVLVRLQRHYESMIDHYKAPEAKDSTQTLNLSRIFYFWALQLDRVRSIHATKVVESLLSTVEQHFDQDKDNVQILFCQRLKGAHLLATGYSSDAAKVLMRVVDAYNALPDPQPQKPAAQYDLAKAYVAVGQVKKAITMLELVVKAYGDLPEDHSDRLTVQYDLARAFLVDKQVNRATVILEHVVEQEKTLAEDHPDRLLTQYKLARAYLESTPKQVDKAVALLEHVARVRDPLEDDNHPRLNALHALIEAYALNGRHAEALGLSQTIMDFFDALSYRHYYKAWFQEQHEKLIDVYAQAHS